MNVYHGDESAWLNKFEIMGKFTIKTSKTNNQSIVYVGRSYVVTIQPDSMAMSNVGA